MRTGNFQKICEIPRSSLSLWEVQITYERFTKLPRIFGYFRVIQVSFEKFRVCSEKLRKLAKCLANFREVQRIFVEFSKIPQKFRNLQLTNWTFERFKEFWEHSANFQNHKKFPKTKGNFWQVRKRKFPRVLRSPMNILEFLESYLISSKISLTSRKLPGFFESFRNFLKFPKFLK